MIRMPGLFACPNENVARTQSAKPMRPAIRSIVAPDSAHSRAAWSSMALTRPASKVGLSISTQGLSPASMVSASNGSFVMSIGGLAGGWQPPDYDRECGVRKQETPHARPLLRKGSHLRRVRHGCGLAHVDRARERAGAQATGPCARLARLRG